QVRLAFADALRAWCALHPVLLVLEDLHWGDAFSVKLIDGALRKLEGERLFLLGLARPEMHERFPAVWQKRHPTEIRLPPLHARASTKLVKEVLGDSASEEMVRRIVERSEGNAFCLEELIRDSAERARRGSVRPPPPNRFPDTVIAVAQARLERLEPRVRK